LVTNANALQVRIWDDEGSDHQEVRAETVANSAVSGHCQCLLMLTHYGMASPLQVPAAHRGFLRRADAIPIEHLFTEACQQKKRLVICGWEGSICLQRLYYSAPALSCLKLFYQLEDSGIVGA
jgi:hypothetical protein